MSYSEYRPIRRCHANCVCMKTNVREGPFGLEKPKCPFGLRDDTVSEQWSAQKGPTEPSYSAYQLGDFVSFLGTLHAQQVRLEGQIWAHKAHQYWWVADGENFHAVHEHAMTILRGVRRTVLTP